MASKLSFCKCHNISPLCFAFWNETYNIMKLLWGWFLTQKFILDVDYWAILLRFMWYNNIWSCWCRIHKMPYMAHKIPQLAELVIWCSIKRKRSNVALKNLPLLFCEEIECEKNKFISYNHTYCFFFMPQCWFKWTC